MRIHALLFGLLLAGYVAGCGGRHSSGRRDAEAGDAAPSLDGQAGDAGPTGVLVFSEPVLTEGEEWSLPSAVEPSPRGGLFLMGEASANPDVRHQGRTLTWADLHPAAGTVDFAPLTAALDRAEADGDGLVLRLKCSVTWRDSPWGDPGPFVPGWVLDACQPPRFFVAPDIEVAAPWDPCVQGHYLDFVAAAGLAGWIEDARLMGLYVHGISTSFGEELWLDEAGVAAAEAAGMTAENLEAAFGERIDAWAEAAGPAAHRLAWVGAGWIPGYGATSDALDARALAQGLGWRGGGLEEFHRYTGPDLGVAFDGEGHLVRNLAWPVTADGRYFGEEVEVWDWVPEAQRPLLYQASILRAVSLGMNFLWTSEEALGFAPEMNHWFTLVAGRPAAEAPVAVVWLREGVVVQGGQEQPFRNFEHYLEQRDGEGLRTVPAERVDRPAMYMDATDHHYDHTARATDVAAGQTGMAFTMNAGFLQSLEGPVTVRVTWRDVGAAWRLEAADDAGVRTSPEVSGPGGDLWRTASFSLSRPPRDAGLDQDADLVLRATGGEDVTVRFVQILR